MGCSLLGKFAHCNANNKERVGCEVIVHTLQTFGAINLCNAQLAISALVVLIIGSVNNKERFQRRGAIEHM